MNQVKRFALIELLVVIAIVAVLAAMLLPALNKARDIAKKAGCINNLKQMGTTLVMYADDFDGRFVSTGCTDQTNDDAREYGWFFIPSDRFLVAQKDYIKNFKVLYCPLDKVRRSSNYAPDVSTIAMKRNNGISYSYYGSYGTGAASWQSSGRVWMTKDKSKVIMADMLGMNAANAFVWNHGGTYAGNYGNNNLLFSDGHVQTDAKRAPNDWDFAYSHCFNSDLSDSHYY